MSSHATNTVNSASGTLFDLLSSAFSRIFQLSLPHFSLSLSLFPSFLSQLPHTLLFISHSLSQYASARMVCHMSVLSCVSLHDEVFVLVFVLPHIFFLSLLFLSFLFPLPFLSHCHLSRRVSLSLSPMSATRQPIPCSERV